MATLMHAKCAMSFYTLLRKLFAGLISSKSDQVLTKSTTEDFGSWIEVEKSHARTLLPIVDSIDSFPYFQNDPQKYQDFMQEYFYFCIQNYDRPVGYIHRSTVEKIDWCEYWQLDHRKRRLVLLATDSLEERSRRVNKTLEQALKSARFHGWKRAGQERFGVSYSHGRGSHDPILNLNLVGADILGVVVSGVTLIAWTKTAMGRRYWLQKRSHLKTHHPGKLDTTASGGIRHDEQPIEAMIREAEEEASIPQDFARENLVSCGTISYHVAVNHEGSPGSCPHVQYTYEVELPLGMVPRPNDGEVDSFVTMTEDEIREALFEDDFKKIVGVIWIGHFCRHGILKPEDDPNYQEICSRLHRRHDFFMLQ